MTSCGHELDHGNSICPSYVTETGVRRAPSSAGMYEIVPGERPQRPLWEWLVVTSCYLEYRTKTWLKMPSYICLLTFSALWKESLRDLPRTESPLGLWPQTFFCKAALEVGWSVSYWVREKEQ